MAEVLSTFELKYQDSAPNFELPDAWGKRFDLRGVAGPEGTIIFFTCNHCPYVTHLAGVMGLVAKEAKEKGVNTVAITSNDLNSYPQDGPEGMKVFSEGYGWDFPYLLDETQMIAKQYGAACTPDFFLFNAEGLLVYSGQFDDSRPGRGEPTGNDLRAAVDVMLSGNVPRKGLPSSGCNIKWMLGNEPRYF